MAVVVLGLFLFLFFLSNSICSGLKNSCHNAPNGTHCGQSETGNCVGYRKNLLTPEDKNYLLWVHNSLRENLTDKVYETKKLPKAFFMKKLVWNEALAKMAQKWADDCTATKQPRLLYQNQLVGQLVLTVDRNKNKNLEDVLYRWTNGLDFLNSDIINEYQEPTNRESDYEAVAQMIWWNTTQLGCGRSNYELKKCNEKNSKCEVTELVCNYFPAGNKEGDPVYLTKRDDKLLCRYDANHALCKDFTRVIKSRLGILNGTQFLDTKTIGNRIKERMRELWPAFGRASLVQTKWESQLLYVLILLATFNVYENLLRN